MTKAIRYFNIIYSTMMLFDSAVMGFRMMSLNAFYMGLHSLDFVVKDRFFVHYGHPFLDSPSLDRKKVLCW